MNLRRGGQLARRSANRYFALTEMPLCSIESPSFGHMVGRNSVVTVALRVAVLSAIQSVTACGSGSTTASAHQEADAGPPLDSLALASCTSPVPDLAHPISFPSPTWDGESPDNVHATICALRSLDALLPTNAVACSGEDTHGVSQSSRLHSLIARYLVLHSGARTIVLEDMDADVAFAQAFVRTGDASQLAKYFGSTAPSLAAVAEVEELLGELHAISDALPNGEQLSIRGMDVAVQVNGTLSRLTGYYPRVNPPNAETLPNIAPTGPATDA